MIEDTELLRRYVETGSQEAFAELVERRIGLVYSVAFRRTGAEHHAKDVAQSVFTDLARKAAALSRHTSLVAWFYRSAYFAAATHMRAEKNRTARETEAHTMSNLLGANSPEADWDKIRPVLDEVLSELDERDREAVLLRFFDNRPFGEIGAQLKLGENAARMRVDRALDKLHGLFARRGIRSTSAALGLLLAQQATAASAPVGLAATTTAAIASANIATASTFAGALQFMAATKTAIALAGVVLIGTTGALLTSNDANRSLEAEISATQREHDTRTSKLAALCTRVEQAEASASKTETDLETARTAQANELKQRQDDMKARMAQGTAWIARHPEVKDLVIKDRKTMGRTYYSRLFKTLALTPAQIDRFLDLKYSGGYGGVLTTPDGQPLLFELGGDIEAAKTELRTLLGETSYKKYREYQTSMEGLQTVIQLGGTLSGTTEPLTASQGERLLQTLAANNTLKSWMGTRLYDWDAIIRDSHAFLSEKQQTYLEDLRAQDELGQARMRERNPNL